MKKIFPCPNELVICAYPENLVNKIRQLVEAMEVTPMGWVRGWGLGQVLAETKN